LAEIADALSCPLEILLRSGSTRLEDKAQEIENMLKGLTETDRQLVAEIVTQICTRLLTNNAP
jgi:hypothetical protein